MDLRNQDYPELVFDFPWAIKQPSLHSSQSSQSRPSRTGVYEDSVAAGFEDTSLKAHQQPTHPGSELDQSAEPLMEGVQASATQLRRPRSREMYPWRAAAPSHRPGDVTSPNVQRPEWLDFSGFSLPEDEPIIFTGPSSPDSQTKIHTTFPPHSKASNRQGIHDTVHARSPEPEASPLPGLPTNTSAPYVRTMSMKHMPHSVRDNEDDRDVLRSAMHFKKASFTSIESVDRSEVSARSCLREPHLLTFMVGTKHRDQTKHVDNGAPAPSPLENHARPSASPRDRRRRSGAAKELSLIHISEPTRPY